MLTITVALEDAFEFIVHKAEVGTLTLQSSGRGGKRMRELENIFHISCLFLNAVASKLRW